jgi:uncharacterized membrane protein/uncharacterized protein YeaO (DUF488 family)
MKFLNLLEPPVEHLENTTAFLLDELNIDYTRSFLRKQLTEHPNYPSLASIADVIGLFYDVACMPLKISTAHILKESVIKAPFLAQIKNHETHHDVFAVVTKFSEDLVELYNPGIKKHQSLAIDTFNKLYQGTLLAVESGKLNEEKDYGKNLKEEKRRRLHNTTAFISIPIAVFLFCILYLGYNSFTAAIAPVLFILITFAGSMVTSALLWYEIDEYNPVVKQICQASAKVNCSAVLNSAASKIKGLSVSILGFTYFTGILMYLLISGLHHTSLKSAGWLALFATPYIFFSVYYQWKVVKQWCKLCLIVQGLLFVQFIIALSNGVFSSYSFLEVPWQSWMGLISALAFVFVVILVLMPALQKAKEEKRKTTELQRMKHNPHIFEGVLSKQKEMAVPADGLGISIGNPEAKYKLIKVCNPYCGPCANAHPIMEELIENNEEVSIQIIFTASDNEKDVKRAPVMHLMAIAAQNDEILTKRALDQWYLADKKDYNAFAEKYPLNGELNNQLEHIKKMYEWCDLVQITATPTFFVRMDSKDSTSSQSKFHLLPEIYTVADLKYFFTI